MAAESIKIPYAERGGDLVHISTFEKGGLKPDCLCLVCKKPLVARVGKIKARHFAHPPDVQPCNPETVLHQLGKWMLAKRIEQALATGKPLRVQWECDACGEDQHTRDVLKGIVSVAVEQQIGPVRPDVALFREDGEAAAVFEIVVTHAPEPEALNFYRDKGIKVWQIALESVEEAERLADLESVPTASAAANYCPLPPLPGCPDPLCHAHGQRMEFRYLRVPVIGCWSCGQPMKAAFIRAGRWTDLYGRDLGPEACTEEELDRARAEGVILVERRNHHAGKRVLANACGHCTSHLGVSFYHNYAWTIGPSKPLARLSYGCDICGRFYPIGTEPPPMVPACSRCAQPLTARYLFIVGWTDPSFQVSRLPVVQFGRYQGTTLGPLDFTLEELTAAAHFGAEENGEQIMVFYRNAQEELRRRNGVPCFSTWWCQHCRCVDQAAGNPPLMDFKSGRQKR